MTQDLVGQKFGMLTVIKQDNDYISPSGYHMKKWLCLCDCQLNLPENQRHLKSITSAALKSGNTKSCGCYRKSDMYVDSRYKDLTGYQFGKFTVIKKVDKPSHIKNSGTYWLCRCDCGRERIIITADINRQNVLCCGECSRNKFIEEDNYFIGYTTKNEPFYFDKEDYELVKDYTWCINADKYVVTWDKELQEFVYMHRLICGLYNGEKYDVDHMNHQRYDNRKNNLRVCSHRNNGKNLSLAKNNTSGITGVRFDNKLQKWIVEIMVNYKTIWLGTFDKSDDALKARREAEDKYFGNYSYNNSIMNGAEIIERNNANASL